MAATASTSATSLKQLLQSTAVRDFAPQRSVVTFDASMSVGKALDTLAAYKILAAPVLENAQVVGIVDMVALVHHLNKKFAVGSPAKVGEAMWAGVAVAETSLKDVLATTKRNFLTVCKGSDSLWSVCELMLSRGGHRVVVLDDSDAVANIISQTDIVGLFFEHIALVPMQERALRDILIGSEHVLTTKSFTSAMEAFRLMVKKRTSSVAVVDMSDHLIDVLSPSDLRGLVPSLFSALHLPIQNFKQRVGREKVALAAITNSTTLREVIKTIVENHIHRVFVTQMNKPKCVISLTDLIRFVLEESK